MAAATFVLEEEEIQVPEFVTDLESFRHWYYSEDFPEQGHICFLQGSVWVDLSMEQVYSHLRVKAIFYAILGNWIENEDLGEYIPDGLRLTNKNANISVEPDFTYISNKTLESNKVQLIEGKTGGYVEVEGTPDMVMEVVSDSSKKKDTVLLKAGYQKAEIPEYWLVDARGEELRFEIHRLTNNGYVAVKKQEGWVKSKVFGKSFRLTVRKNKMGNPKYKLEIR